MATNKSVETQTDNGLLPEPIPKLGNGFTIHFQDMPPGCTVSTVLAQMKFQIQGFDEYYKIASLQDSAFVRPKISPISPTNLSPQTSSSKNIPSTTSQKISVSGKQQAQNMGPSTPAKFPRISTPWAIIATSMDNDLPFFRNWFLNHASGLLERLCCRKPNHQFFLPFATSAQLDQALEISKELIQADPSITIARWNRLDVREEFVANFGYTTPDPTKAIFVRGTNGSDQTNMRTILQDFGTISRIIPTSVRTAIVEFRTTLASTALAQPLPSTHQHLHLEAYRERIRPRSPTTGSTISIPAKRLRTDDSSAPMDLADAGTTESAIASGEAQQNGNMGPKSGNASGGAQQNDSMGQQQQQTGSNDITLPVSQNQETEQKLANPEQNQDIDMALQQLKQGLANSSPIDSEPGTGGGEQEPTPTPSPARQQTPNLNPSTTTIDPAQIQASWTKTNANTWVLYTKGLDQALSSQGLKCVDVPRDGNCGYSAIITAGGLPYSYSRLKNNTKEFLSKNEQQIRSTFSQHIRSGMDSFITGLHKKLSTPGVYINNFLLQLVAWNIHQNLAIHDVLDHHILTLQGQCPWTAQASSLPTIHIAYRRHQQHYSYDANFNPLRRMDGHYWAIVKTPQRPARPPPNNNNNPFAVLAVDDVEMSDADSLRPQGNRKASVSPRH